MKKKIKAEQVEFIYSNDFILEGFNKDKILITTDAIDFVAEEELKKNCRVIITIDEKIRHKTYIDYLYWFDDTDLNILDSKIEAENYEDTDFFHSIKTYFGKNLFCHSCKSTFTGGLVVDGGDFYIGNRELAWQKLKLLRASGRLKCCPNCSENFRIIVTHIFI